MVPLIVVAVLAGICAAQSERAKTLVLEKNEGETRVRRPRGSLPVPSNEFILKVTPQTGSPVSPSLSEATICWMYPTYVLIDRADRDFFILFTNGLTVTLLTPAKGMSPMAGRIHLLRAASMLLASLMGSRSRVMAQPADAGKEP